eukprot:scaffold108_cov302-Prasinococcus_capsulatus_cf.AAC.5
MAREPDGAGDTSRVDNCTLGAARAQRARLCIASGREGKGRGRDAPTRTRTRAPAAADDDAWAPGAGGRCGARSGRRVRARPPRGVARGGSRVRGRHMYM